jgi:hypothetical protein
LEKKPSQNQPKPKKPSKTEKTEPKPSQTGFVLKNRTETSRFEPVRFGFGFFFLISV